jgi:hypothetical protein
MPIPAGKAPTAVGESVTTPSGVPLPAGPAESVYTWPDGDVGDHDQLPTMDRGFTFRSVETPRRRRATPSRLRPGGQIIKATIDAYHDEKPSGWRPPFFQVTATEI